VKPHPTTVPWFVAELAYSRYASKHETQTLQRIAERGGFSAAEMDSFLPDWRERCSEPVSLRAPQPDVVGNSDPAAVVVAANR